MNCSILEVDLGLAVTTSFEAEGLVDNELDEVEAFIDLDSAEVEEEEEEEGSVLVVAGE